jgi:hypothetical protein
MRQPGSEFATDPTKAISTEAIPAPVLPASFAKDHARWANNGFLARQHNFCGKQCVSFLTPGSLQKEEETCLQTCFKKYSLAMKSLQEEKGSFFAALDDLALRGEDKYAARGI